MNNFVDFMRAPAGRLLRIAIGIVLIWWGFFANGGVILGIVGFVPLLAGMMNFCLVGPLFHRTFWGKVRV